MELKDTVPPNNLDAEKAILGAILLDWNSISVIVSYITKDCFYSIQNQVIYEAMIKLFSTSTKADTITLIDELNKSGNLQKAGGVAYITELTGLVPTSANLDYYAKIVLDAYTKRRLILISQDIKAASFDETKEARTILEDAEQKIFSLTDASQTTSIIKTREVMFGTMKLLESRLENRGSYSGIASGLQKLDNMTSGFQDSEMIIIGARPSMGKTALALSMIQNIAIGKKIPTGFFTLEMSSQQIMLRLLSQVSKVAGFKMRDAMFSLDDMRKIEQAADLINAAPLFIVDTPNMKLLDLRAMARRMVSVHKVKIIFIDYIGLITCENTKLQMFEQVSEISKSLKSLARELKIPIVALCQVARDAEGQEPSLNQLRGSGSIEQDADVVMFIHRERKKTQEENDTPSYTQEAKIIVAKQRNGPIGDVKVIFIPTCTRFENEDPDKYPTQ